MPPTTDLVHSLVRGEVLVAKEAVETASRSGEAPGWSPWGNAAGLISGDNVVEGGEGVGEGTFVPFPLLLSPLARGPKFDTQRPQEETSKMGLGRLMPWAGDLREFGAMSCHRCDHTTAVFAILPVFLRACGQASRQRGTEPSSTIGTKLEFQECVRTRHEWQPGRWSSRFPPAQSRGRNSGPRR